jgi:tetratricopeptide (TPR) repeat protein
MLSALAHAYAKSGNSAEAQKLLLQLREQSTHSYVSPYYMGIVYLAMGKNDAAMDWLEKAFADRSNGLVFLKVEPELDSLRSNPRFAALERKLKFPQ